MNWESLLTEELTKDYFKSLAATIKSRQNVLPTVQLMFRAFETVRFDDIRVVILGQDPYHGENQANGLAFSVNSDQQLPPSLKNIFKEIKNDLGVENTSGDLSSWARQGVLLMNCILSVEKNNPGSHVNLGWEKFTDKIICGISENLNNVVFMLWGSYAKSKESLIDNSKHLVLSSSHPSPLSAHVDFFGCKHFSLANEYLNRSGRKTIDWRT